ncbi:MAG: cytochrome C oxidase subunit II [Hyphomicrobiaceae bacterium]|nr:MAG: cytochrome C oxidase subunit II [Hyphomicrobiaceae bacterium]
MAITPPEQRIWWNEPVEKAELMWIGIAFLWGVIMFFMMVYWHINGKQNLSAAAYRIDPLVFEKRAETFAKQFKVREEGKTKVPVVKPPAGGDVYMLSRLWEWWPVLELEKGRSYRLHLSSMDWQHGFSLQPVNINIQVHPGIEHVLTITPTDTGTFHVVCNEFCGVGHHTMVGRIHVVEQKAASIPSTSTTSAALDAAKISPPAH